MATDDAPAEFPRFAGLSVFGRFSSRIKSAGCGNLLNPVELRNRHDRPVPSGIVQNRDTVRRCAGSLPTKAYRYTGLLSDSRRWRYRSVWVITVNTMVSTARAVQSGTSALTASATTPITFATEHPLARRMRACRDWRAAVLPASAATRPAAALIAATRRSAE